MAKGLLLFDNAHPSMTLCYSIIVDLYKSNFPFVPHPYWYNTLIFPMQNIFPYIATRPN